MNGYLIIDGNSISHAANNGTPLSVGSTPTQAVYGVLRTMRRLMAIYSAYKPVVLWDGISWRKRIFTEYKANRDAMNTIWDKRAQASKDTLNKQKPIIRKTLSLLGIPQITATNMEADDLAAILVDKYRKGSEKPAIVLVTGDKDWLQLVEPGVVWLDPIHDRKVTHKNFEEFTGVKTSRQFVEVKAICGDKGDNIAGVGGIGQKGAVEFINTYESFTNFSNRALDKAFDVSKLPKKLRDLAEDEAKRITFIQNMNLVDLRTTVRPKPEGLNVEKGDPSACRFVKLCHMLMFKSIIDQIDDWLCVFPAFVDGSMTENDKMETKSAKTA